MLGIREAEALTRSIFGTPLDVPRPLDVGKLVYHAWDGTLETRYFANVCSFGASGRVVRERISSDNSRTCWERRSIARSCCRALRSFGGRLRDRYDLRQRGTIEVKGKGRMATWWLEGRLSPPR